MLQKLQNRAARIVTNSSYDAPAAILIKELKWPTVHDMIKQETTTIVFKSMSNQSNQLWYRAHLPLYFIHEKLDTGDCKFEKS